MSYNGFIVKVKDVRPHPNADRLQIATFFGNDVCIGIDIPIGELGIYFPSDGQLSEEYCEYNNLVRKKDDAGNNIGGYMDPNKRNVKAICLRGERSDGIYMAISSLEFTGAKLDEFKEGDTITIVNGHEICKKYIPKRPNRGSAPQGNRVRKKKVPIAPLFMEHADTEQLAYNLSAFRPGDQIEITLKMHGTSQRTGYLPKIVGYKRTLIDRIMHREGTPIYDWGYVSGTRRVVLDDYDGGFYGDNSFREEHSKMFEGKLQKGETVYYEVVGFQSSGQPIMGTCSNKKLNDKEFIKQYGEETVFSYGCAPDGKPTSKCQEDEHPQSDMYVYRMTMTNEDGFVTEYTPEYMRYRCEQINVKTVPVFSKFFIPNEKELDLSEQTAGEYVQKIAQTFLNTNPDPIGKTHIKEGVVIRIINRPKFCAYKDKVFEFKVLEGIIKETAEVPDIEEAQELLDKN
jgi:hypothetical protein